ncbi:hypothetical protein DICVIV_13809 [Dictyocaulus viviparus]|uniref:Uncharacterized protein n=1 Tax=Dictyocaulus viviparus TaxID=29172 RepID=A0A0D8X6T8_DICVI|nr:hypothetical protein DICVIV_13809 [Dictyocaulus viviparus]
MVTLLAKGLGAFQETLEPLVQACHLLQMIAILQHYAPSDDFEERDVDADLLMMIQRRLNQRANANGVNAEDQNTLIVMGTYLQPFDCHCFVHSDFPLQTLLLPTCLHLQQFCSGWAQIL